MSKTMPLYDYQCQACGARVEVMHKIADAPPACPACGADALKKQLSAPNFRLAGGGWYETDFKDKAKQDPRKLAGGGGESAEAKPAGGDGDAKATPAAAGGDPKGGAGTKADTPAPTAAAPAPAATTAPTAKPSSPAPSSPKT